MSVTRRKILAGAAAILLVLATRLPAHAQDAAAASTFVQKFGASLVDVVNGPGADSAKQGQIRTLIDSSVDVDGIARFCLGRFVNEATPQQVAQYTTLFHSVLVDNITAKIGQYKGVTFQMTETAMRGDEAYVGTIVQRPGNAPVNVRWVVATVSGAPKVVDVIAEGTSLRLTQRSDYASYLSHNGNSIAALIGAMKRMVEANG